MLKNKNNFEIIHLFFFFFFLLLGRELFRPPLYILAEWSSSICLGILPSVLVCLLILHVPFVPL